MLCKWKGTQGLSPLSSAKDINHPMMELNLKKACRKKCFRWVNTSQVPWAGVLGCGPSSLLTGYLGISVQRLSRWKWTCWNKLTLFIRTNEMLKKYSSILAFLLGWSEGTGVKGLQQDSLPGCTSECEVSWGHFKTFKAKQGKRTCFLIQLKYFRYPQKVKQSRT